MSSKNKKSTYWLALKKPETIGVNKSSVNLGVLRHLLYALLLPAPCNIRGPCLGKY